MIEAANVNVWLVVSLAMVHSTSVEFVCALVTVVPVTNKINSVNTADIWIFF
jgi:hypothetical protein